MLARRLGLKIPPEPHLFRASYSSSRVIIPPQMEEYAPFTEPIIKGDNDETWTPLYWHNCSFTPRMFGDVMMNLIRNPNINSNHLFRADILLEKPYSCNSPSEISVLAPRILNMEGYQLNTVIVRKLIPRNALVDDPLDQSCLLYDRQEDLETKSLVLYIPHISEARDSPFYHPAVRGIGFLHSFNSFSAKGNVSIHYSFFDNQVQPYLQRTAFHLLATVHKHGQGSANGYVKRVHHDTVIPQATVQNTYALLKAKHAKSIISAWVESTDPVKHVFEDLGIAAFLIELWAQMYPTREDFPGFVDIGCGNGLLVHILLEEGYSGCGFDARRRKSWEIYSANTQEKLQELVLIPEILKDKTELQDTADPQIHNGIFPKGTFIISNHADELTPWTPILATLSDCPFMMIPCCSHNLTGSRFRATPSKKAGASASAYASLVEWVTKLGEDCGWEIEKEMLRIPSTRNTALIGRRRSVETDKVDIEALIIKHGGAAGWKNNAMKLVSAQPRGH